MYKKLLEDLNNLMYENELEYHTQMIKIYKNHIRFIYGVFLLNICSFIWIIFNLIYHQNIIVYLSLFILLTIGTYININNLKRTKKKIKENKIQYDDIIKIINPTEYIKNQRKEKLKRLKRFNLFH